MLIGLIRHGITDYNEHGRLQGWLDIPLNDKGRQQALLIANKLSGERRWSLIISSDLLRAIQTAKIISDINDIPMISSDAIRERTFGIYEGQKINDCRNMNKDYIEKKGCFEKRVIDFVSETISSQQNKNVIIVSHQGVLKVISNYLGNKIYAFTHTELYTYSV